MPHSSLFYQKVVSLHTSLSRIYASKVNPTLLRNTLQSVILQIGGKFIYGKVEGGYRADDVKRALQMLCDAGIDLYYWENIVNGTSSEIDYVTVKNMKVMPIECKAGTSGKMKSLRLFMRNKHLNEAYRCSLENFALLEYQNMQADNAIRRIVINPLYAISNI